jgi:hypothetical protein
MLNHLLDKFNDIKKRHKLYCDDLEKTLKENPSNQDKKPLHLYDFFCKNTRGQGPTSPSQGP